MREELVIDRQQRASPGREMAARLGRAFRERRSVEGIETVPASRDDESARDQDTQPACRPLGVEVVDPTETRRSTAEVDCESRPATSSRASHARTSWLVPQGGPEGRSGASPTPAGSGFIGVIGTLLSSSSGWCGHTVTLRVTLLRD